jgi:hypothetical protein
MSSTNTNIDDLINKLPNDALTPEAADALGRTESFEPAPAVDAVQPVTTEAVQPVTTEAVQQAPTGGGKKTFKRKGGRKHRRKTHKKNKRRSSKRRQ